MAQAVFETTATAQREKSKLQRHFRRFDVFFYLICTVVTIDTIGAVASNGAQGFTWLIFLGVLFFLPYALSVAELGSAFPQEGGPYVWSRLAFGRPLAAINSVIYWISNPIWIGGSLTIVSFAAIEEFFGPVGGPWKYVYALGFIWFTIGTAIVSLRYGKWVPTLGAWARGAVLTFFVVSVAIYAARFGAGGNPNDDLAALSFSHQRLQYELTQIVPLGVIVGLGVLFYVLGGKTRREAAAEPVAPAYVTADSQETAH